MIDYVRQDKESKRGLETGIKGLFPIKGKNHDLDIKDIEITSKFGPSDLSQQKEDKLKGNTFSGEMKGTFVLKDKSGKVIDQKRMKVMNVPTVTERGSYIIKGTEYNVPYQFRRKPGVYSRVQDDGNLTAEVNLAKGANFKVMLDDDEKFYMLYRGNKIPLYPVLTAMGKTRGEIEKVWGKELVDINSAVDQEKPVKKLYKKMGGDPTDNFEEMKTGIQSYFNETSMDPDVTKQTLGKEFDRVSSDLLSQTSKKLLDIKKGRDKPDERDSLRFKSVVGHEDFIKERVEKQAYGITRKIKNRLDNKDKVSDIVSASVFDKPINSFYHDGEVALSGTPRQANPIDMLSEAQKITLTGAGGLTNPEAVTDEARSVHPSSMGFVDPVFTPESSQIGLTLHTAMGAQKEGTSLTTKVINRKTGKEERIDPATLEDSTVSFADEYEIKNGKYKPKSRKVRAYSSKGKMESVDPKDVDYIIKDGKMMFSLASNLVPFLQSTHPNRGMMASKMMSQALPLTHKETPLVQTTINGQKIHQKLGEAFVSKAKSPGTVKSITRDHIVVQHKDGEEKYPYYRDFPLNENHFSNDKILVKKGDRVSKGQRLTENMFTDKGSLAYGTNLRTAYMAPKGLTFEDAVVISESASEKLKSEHMYTKDVELDKSTVTSLPKFRLYAPTALSSKNAKKLDQDGVIKKGETVESGDIVIAGLKKMAKTPDEEIIGKFNKKIKPYRKYTKEWDHDTPGVVTDVVKSPKGIQVYIKTQEKAQVGDKTSGSFGNKGVISEILPDHEMPMDKEGRHTEIIMNPLGIPSRINPSQLLSTAAGKIAEKTGKPYEIENMSSIDYLSKIKKDLKDNGLSDKEELFDPTTNRSLGNIMTGKQYIMKLDHNVEKKLSARGPMGEAEYTEDLTPTAGKGRGGQSADALTVYSLMSHGAKENLKEMATTKAEKNDEFWMALESGMPLPNPKPTFAWKKFISKLKASGINVQENGNKIQLMPLTDKQVTEMSNGEIQKEDLIRSKNLVPMKGGLFDKDITGGARGEKWSHVKLSEPMVNPVFIKPVSKLLGITTTDIDKITSGDLYLDKNGKKVSKDSPDAQTGTKAIKRALKSINVNSKLSELEQKAKNSKGNDLDNINRQIRYLRNLKKLNYKPDVFMSSKVPVLPPIFRPVYPMPDGNLRTSHINVPYKDLITINNQIKDAKKIGIPEDQMKEAKAQLFDAYKALVGVANPVTRKEFKGTLESVVGARPKTGYYQSKLISRRQELTGRSTIIPNPSLAMDEVEIPEDILWNIYKPFVKKNMKNQGYSILQSGEEIERRSDVARRSLDKELARRPVMLNRAPSLHKFSVMAFHPKRSSKKAISLNPFVVSGFNADFDGDTVSVHVPIREKARKEAYKMLPSANLFSPRDNSLVHKPSMEVITGLNMLTRVKKKTNKKYTSDKQALDAYKDKYIGMNDEITVGNEKTTVGRILLNRNLPNGLKVNAEMTKKTMNNYLRDVATKKPQLYAKVNETLRDFGNDAVFKGGFTIGLDDVSFDQKKRDSLFDSVEKSLGKNPSDEKIVNAYARVSEKLNDQIDKLPDTNAFKLMMDSGSKGNAGQIRQVMMAPTQVQDLNENPVLMPIRHSYAEGLSTGEYMATQAGARRTMMDRALQTKWPGALNKEVVNSTSTQVVNSNDCGTREGIMMDVDDDNILNRYVANDPSGTLKYNSLIDTTSRSLLKKKKVKSIKVRTPLKCKLVHGICSKCFGKDETGNDPDIGSNIGIKAAQTISEPATQMSVSGNTKVVFVKDGEVCVDRIGSIIDREISNSGKMDKHGWEVAEAGIKSFSLEKNGKVSLRDVSVLSRHKAPEMMVKIKTMGGREIVATPYHSFVIRDENKIMKAPATSLRIGKRIPVLKQIPLPGKKKVVDLDSTEVVWAPISSIEYVYPDTDYVYDFTVPGPQNFATFDGIITANTMKTFHTGGASGQTQNISQGFWRIQDLLHLRSSLPNKAILSQESGRVDSVKASPTGGFDVFVNNVKHHVPSGRKVIVSEKAKIERGDALSDGPAKPQDIAELKDMDGASKYLVDELDKTYKANGIKIDRRMLETVARPMTTTARVLDPGDSDFAPGDFANINDVESRNKKLKNKIQVEPKMIGINSVPLYTEDWLNRLNSTRLKDTLVDGASMGFVSEISPRLSPIGSYAYGVEKTASDVEDELDFNWFEDVYPSIEWFGEENATS